MVAVAVVSGRVYSGSSVVGSVLSDDQRFRFEWTGEEKGNRNEGLERGIMGKEGARRMMMVITTGMRYPSRRR